MFRHYFKYLSARGEASCHRAKITYASTIYVITSCLWIIPWKRELKVNIAIINTCFNRNYSRATLTLISHNLINSIQSSTFLYLCQWALFIIRFYSDRRSLCAFIKRKTRAASLLQRNQADNNRFFGKIELPCILSFSFSLFPLSPSLAMAVSV